MRALLIAAFLLFFIQCFAQLPLENLREEVKENIRSGQYNQAITTLENKINSIGNDTTGLFDALINLYLFKKNWGAIINAYTFHEYKQGEDTTTLAIARFNSKNPDEKIYLEHQCEIPYKSGIASTPIIGVKVNGKEYHFWFDTGAGMTVLSSRTATECNIKQAHTKNGVATAATGNVVELDPGLIDSLEINSLKVYNHPCIILSKEDLEFRIFGIRVFKIDGIIGWNLLQEFDVTINQKSEIITMASYEAPEHSDHNFFWLGQPLVKGSDSSGASFLFFIDTGFSGSGLYEPFVAKSDTTHLKKKVTIMASAGGFKKIRSFVFPLIKLNVGGKLLELKDVSLYPHPEESLFSCDGVLGINEFKKSTINFNVRKGLFVVRD